MINNIVHQFLEDVGDNTSYEAQYYEAFCQRYEDKNYFLRNNTSFTPVD